MGVTDYGTQTISFDFKEPGKSENFNKLNYKITQKGIYEGGGLTYVDPTHISLAPFIVYVEDSTTGVSVRIKTASIIELLVASSATYCILRFDWSNTENNYADILMVDYASLDVDDLIFGRTVYDVTTLETFFDYSRKSTVLITEDIIKNSEFKVLPQEPYTNTVLIQGGTINTGLESIVVSSGNSAIISDTTLGRNDIIYLKSDGNFGVLEGVDSASPETPSYGSKFVLCEIQRGASKTYITGADIVQISNNNLIINDFIEVEVVNAKRPAIDNTIIPKFIGEEYTNLVTDPTDLTTGNWDKTKDNVTVIKKILGGASWYFITTAGSTYDGLVSASYISTQQKCVVHGTARRGTANDTQLQIWNSDTAHNSGVRVNWDTHVVSNFIVALTDITYKWLDDNTIELWVICDVENIGDSISAYPYANYIDATAGVGTYWKNIQITEGTTLFPFVDGTHSADVIDEAFTMPDKFAIDMIVEPKFAYDTSIYHALFFWKLDETHKFQLNYNAGSTDRFYLTWQDGGIVSYLVGNRFDDGTSYINLNQKLRFIVLANLVLSEQDSSDFIIIEEDGTIHEYTLWDQSNPDVKTSTFPLLHIGNSNIGTNQANSDFEYLRIYSWDGVKPTITSSDDAEQYFQQQSMIFEAIPDAFIPRTIDINTPISSAIQQLTNDVRTGQGIQDGAILERHLANPQSAIVSREVISSDITLESGYRYLITDNVELQLPTNPVEGDVIDILASSISTITQSDVEHSITYKDKFVTTKGVIGALHLHKGDHIELTYKGSGIVDAPLTRLADPSTLPTGNGRRVSFSPDSIYFAVPNTSSPYLSIYKRSGSTLTLLVTDAPDTIPIGTAWSSRFSPDGEHLVVGMSAEPFLYIYKRIGDTFIRLTVDAPDTPPTGNSNEIEFSSDGVYLAIAHDTSPSVSIYKRNGDTYIKLPNPSTLPVGQGESISFSLGNKYLAVGTSSDPYVIVYKRSGDTFTALVSPFDTLPSLSVSGIAFSKTDNYLALGSATSTYLWLYKYIDDAFERILINNTPSSTIYHLKFSDDGSRLIIGMAATPYFLMYRIDKGVFIEMPDLVSLPTGSINGVAFSSDGLYLGMGHNTTPFMDVYNYRSTSNKQWLISNDNNMDFNSSLR